MKIKQILVCDLFGMFNHEINLNLEDRITIIHGPNGVGKTILLRMINAIFNSRYSELRPIPFTTLTINLDDGSHLDVARKNIGEVKGESKLTFSFYDHRDSKSRSFEPDKPSEQEEIRFPLSVLEEIEPDLQRIGGRTWFYAPTHETLSLSDVIERFGESLPINYRPKKDPAWLDKLKKSMTVRFIESQRLLTKKERRAREYSRGFSMVYSVNTYADELAEQIQAKQAEYATLSQSLDRTFPARVVKQKSEANLPEEMLSEKFNEVERQRQRLIKVGLLNDETSDFELEPNIDHNTKQILSVYLEDVEKKLSVFQELAQKIELFQKIIATKFQYKHMHISKDKGFTFTTHDGNPLAPTYLSSGEQHELVMLYELLFKVKPNSLILIDEPELSLHVGWQVEFLEDLQQIAKLGNFDVLMATHSPSLIDDRWDLTVALKG